MERKNTVSETAFLSFNIRTITVGIGISPIRGLTTFVDYNHQQGISPRPKDIYQVAYSAFIIYSLYLTSLLMFFIYKNAPHKVERKNTVSETALLSFNIRTITVGAGISPARGLTTFVDFNHQWGISPRPKDIFI